jgi:hypothetical protein
MTYQECVAQMRSELIGSTIAIQMASMPGSVSEVVEKVERIKNRYEINQLRLLQIEARADTLQRKLSAFAAETAAQQP